MYKLEYQNLKNKKEAVAKINAITGNILITTFSNKIIEGKFIEDSIKISSISNKTDVIQSVEKNKFKPTVTEPVESKQKKSNSFTSKNQKDRNEVKESKKNSHYQLKKPELKSENNF